MTLNKFWSSEVYWAHFTQQQKQTNYNHWVNYRLFYLTTASADPLMMSVSFQKFAPCANNNSIFDFYISQTFQLKSSSFYYLRYTGEEITFKIISPKTWLLLEIGFLRHNIRTIFLTNFRPMFHLRINHAVSFYKQNVWKTPVEVDDLYLYLKCHSSTGVFQTFC